jgi:ribosomal protein L11
MKTNLRIGLLLTIGLGGCGSSPSSPKTNADSDAPAASPDAAAADSKTAADLPAGTNPDFAAVADVFVPSADDIKASDGPTPASADGPATADSPSGSDATRVDDVAAPVDAPPGADAPPASSDSTSHADAGTLVSSTSTPDNPSGPTICSTVVLGDHGLSADQSYDIVMPDCLRLSGTVTLDGALPAGAAFGNGQVNAFMVTRDANNKVTDTVSYAAEITAVDDSHFRYSIGLPAGTYELMYNIAVKSGAQIPSVASRIGQEHLTINTSLKHDVTLPAIDLASYTVTLTGTDALASNGSAFGRFIEVIVTNLSNTLMVTGISMTGGAAVPITMWIPKETITPFIMVQMSPVAFAPYASGSVNQFKLDPVTPTGDFSLAMPAIVKISGAISDPHQNLTPMLGIGGSGTSGISYYQFTSMDTGTFPDPIFFYPEGSTSNFFSASTSHAFYVRKGLTGMAYANYAIAMGAKGATPTTAGENTYAYMEDPTPRSSNAVTLTADVTRDIAVPDLGAQVTVIGTVKDARGAAIPNAHLNFNSRSLTTAAVADKTFVGNLDVSSAGTYTLHALPGTYAMWIALTKTTGSATTPDGGVPANQDAAVMPDLGFSLPDVATGGADCTTLAACCPSLPSMFLTTCNAGVSSNVALTCAGILHGLNLQGYCQ